MSNLSGFECRGCFNSIDKISEKINLFDYFTDEDQNTTISDLFAKYTSLEIKKCDEFSTYLCSTCYDKLKNFHEFRELCIATHLKFVNRKFQETFETVLAETSTNEVFIKEEEVDEESPEIDDFDDAFSNDFYKNDLSNDEDCEEPEMKLESLATDIHQTNDSALPENVVPERRKLREKRTKKQKVENDANDSLTNENQNTESKNNLSYKCPTCKKIFYKKHNYDGHLRTHLGLKQFKCEHCDKEFCKWRSYIQHKKEKHTPGGKAEKKFICDVNSCGKAFPKKVCFSIHIYIVFDCNY